MGNRFRTDRKGAIISLGDNVEGFAGSRQLVKEDGTTAKEGETLDFKVLEFSKATKRILLSHTRIFEEVKNRRHRQKRTNAVRPTTQRRNP